MKCKLTGPLIRGGVLEESQHLYSFQMTGRWLGIRAESFTCVLSVNEDVHRLRHGNLHAQH